MQVRGKVHNAKVCTFDGRDCWIATICDDKGEFRFHPHGLSGLVSEHATESDALAWIREIARARGFDLLSIAVRQADVRGPFVQVSP